MIMNKLLFYARNLCYLINGLNLICFIALIWVIVYSIIDSTAFEHIVVTDISKSGFGIGNFKICSSCAKTTDTLLSDLGTGIKIWILVRGGTFSVLLFLVVNSVLRILRSIGSREAFYSGNVLSFKRMATYGFIAALLSAFNFAQVGGTTNWHFSLPLVPLAFSLGCLILAEIFREGARLSEDNHSIV